MRTSISIPDEYYVQIKPKVKELGYMTLSDFILDLIRKKYPAEPEKSNILEEPIKELIPKPITTDLIDFSKISTAQPYDIEEIVSPNDPSNPESVPQRISFLLDKCEMFSCGKPSMGRYIVTIYIEGEEIRKEFFMCKTHVANARRSGGVPIKV